MHDTLNAPASAEELRAEVERLRLLHSISLEFSASLDFEELIPRVFERVLTVLGAEGGSLWIAEGDMLVCRLAQGGAGQKLVGAQMPVGTGFVGDVAQRPRTTIVTRALNDPRYQAMVTKVHDDVLRAGKIFGQANATYYKDHPLSKDAKFFQNGPSNDGWVPPGGRGGRGRGNPLAPPEGETP